MKPLKITLQAFGSYIKKSSVDFSKFYDRKIFLITGSTGSGKTTILDAMCFALYCRATGGLRSWSDMRNIAADESTPTIVDFEFILKDTTYRFVRSLKIHHIRNSDKTRLKDEHACYKKINGVWELLASGSESKVREYAEYLLGLDCDQFSKVIILPQGEFKNLLLANSSDKAKIFQKLFSAEYWEKLSDITSNLAKDVFSELRVLSINKETILKKEACQNIDEISQKKEEHIAEYQEIKANCKKSEEKIQDLTSIIEKIKTLNLISENLDKRKIEVKEKESKLSVAQRNFDSINLKSDELSSLKSKLKNHIAEISSLEKSLKDIIKLETIEKEISSLTKQKDNFLEKEKAITADIQQNQSAIEKGEKYLEEISIEAKLIPSLFLESENLKKIIDSYNDLESFKKEVSALKVKLQAKNQIYKEHIVSLSALNAKFKNTKDILDQNASYSLAINLKNNEPCPVCGSTIHPDPQTHFEDSEIPLDEQIDSLSQAISKQEKLGADLQLEISLIEEKIQEKNVEIELKNTICKQFDQNKELCQTKLKEILSSLDHAKTSESHITPSINKIHKLKNYQETLKKHLDHAENSTLSINNELEASKKNKSFILSYIKDKENSKTLSEKLEATRLELNSFEKQIDSLEKSISTAKSNLDIANTNLLNAKTNYSEEKTKYDNLNLDESLKNTSSIEDYETSLISEKKENLKLTEQSGKIFQLVNSINASIYELSNIEKAINSLNIEYSKINRVSLFMQGKNALRTPIKMFVLGIILDDILSCANIYFATFSQNRYSLSRMVDKKSKRGFTGLDIEVFDSHHGSVRSVATLSGGELFLASLALAFGLSDVVQSYSGSVKLDSIFIDEGFGTLDQNTLDTALYTLNQIQKMGRLVGVISHVKEIKDQIPCKIEIIKSECGNQEIVISTI